MLDLGNGALKKGVYVRGEKTNTTIKEHGKCYDGGGGGAQSQ